MTACVNNTEKKAKGGVFQSKVLRAAMAGVLAVGMMPVMALAAEPAESEAAPMEVAGAPQRFSAGEIATVTDTDGYTVTADDNGAYPLQAGKGLTVTVLPLDESDAVTADVEYATKAISGSAAADTYTYNATVPTTPGTYYAAAKGTGDYANGVVYFKVVIAQKSLDGAFAYVGDKVEEKNLVFNFADQADDIKWAIGTEDVTDYVQVAGWYQDGKAYTGEIRNAGTYVAQLKGVDGDYSGAIEYVEVTVDKLDLGTVTYEAKDYAYSAGNPITVDEPTASVAGLNNNKAVEWKLSGPTTSGLVVEKGTYTWTVSVNPDNEGGVKNLEGTASVDFSVRGTIVPAENFKYNEEVIGADIMSKDAPLSFDKSSDDKDKQGFDAKKLTVVDEEGKEYVQNDDYTISFERQNADGTWSATSSTDATGDYRMTVSMNGSKDLGGTVVGYFSVTNGEISGTDMFVTFEGDPVNGDDPIETTYDGENVIEDIEVTVRKDGKVLAEGTDYTVEFSLDGKKVDSVVDADDYVMTITPVTYDGEAVTVDIHVAAIEAYSFRAFTGNFDGLLYTGEDITPQIEFQTAENPFQVEGAEEGEYVDNPKYVSSILPTDVYSIKDIEFTAPGADKTVKVDSIKEPGAYKFTVAFYGDVKNYTYDPEGFKTVEVVVLDKLNGFKDVNSTDWFVGPVNTVNNAGWMNGFAGTQLFGPNANITRADVVCVLYNMAGGDKLTPIQYPAASEFSDVAGYMYYTAPINWAAKTGIANGYGDGNFGPNDQITREQFASLLANFAHAYGVYVAPTADISGMPGAEGVSGWALENVQWAVENGIMGNNGADLNAQGTITRAEVAAMVSNYAEAFDLI